MGVWPPRRAGLVCVPPGPPRSVSPGLASGSLILGAGRHAGPRGLLVPIVMLGAGPGETRGGWIVA
jgi:hypothetical protein